MKYYGPMLEAATSIETSTGGPLPYPDDNDTLAVGEAVNENSQVSTQDVPLGSIVFNAYNYSSKMVKVSNALVQDFGFDIQSYLAEKFGARIGRKLNTLCTTGSGTGEPQGIVTGATTSGITAAGSAANTGGAETGATSIGSDDLNALQHSVDPVYRGGASVMMHDNTLKALQQVKDKQGRPLWPNLPAIIDGCSVLVNNDMAPIATGVKSVLFGAIGKYAIRKAGGITVLRLDSRFAEFRQVGFLAFARRDARLLDAGTGPVKYLTQAWRQRAVETKKAV
jgi:HK97 family phage major capsid protein